MIVVTGASGFIGSNVVAALCRRGCSRVIAVDEYPHIRGKGLARPTRRMQYLDALQVAGCLDLQDALGWLRRDGPCVKGVIHLGACSDTTISDRDFVMSRNFEYTRDLWRWCTGSGRPLVYASSAATYGDGSAGYDDRMDPRVYQPLNLYGESKQRFDLWALEQPQSPPRWAGVKYFNVYGPNEGHKGRMASVVFHAFHQISKTGQVRLFQSHREGIPHGCQRRDFVYVADAVDATLHLFETPADGDAPNGLYNVGTGAARTFRDLVRAVFAAMNREPDIAYIPMPEDLRGRYQYFTQAVMTKLYRSGFPRPFRSIENGVLEYVRGYLLPSVEGAGQPSPANGKRVA